ncbi:hypothetical protein [Dokdonella sp.]|uniref:hypothetical protein n=1 Tax=Dokdonella sp. TaxID=2291710 RepID=UPI002F3E4786
MNSDRNDEQLEQVRGEIRAAAATLRDRPRLPSSAPAQASGADGIEPARRRYRIAELTDPPYHAFVEHAFRALLKRAPTAAEASAQLDLLGRGASKAEVLGNLRWSAEGRRQHVGVAGLLPRYIVAKLGRVPLLGYLVEWGTSLAALPMLARQLRAADAAISAGDAALAARLQPRIDELRELVHGLGLARDELIRSVDTLDERLRAHAAAAEAVLGDLARRQHDLEGARKDELEFVRRRVYVMNRWFEALQGALAEVESAADRRDAGAREFEARTRDAIASADASRVARLERWSDALDPACVAGARIVTIGDDADWNERWVSKGVAATPLATPRAADAAALRDALARIEDGALAALAVLAFPALLRAMPADEFVAAASRVLRADGFLLIGFAAEPVLAATLAGDAVPAVQPAALATVLAAAGYSTRRVDAADGTPALLASKAAR